VYPAEPSSSARQPVPVPARSTSVGRRNLRNNLAYTGTLTSNLTGTNVDLPYNGAAPDLGAFENDGR
jgi:hypothetical protein